VCATGHELKECAGVAKQEEEDMSLGGTEPSFIFVRLPVLREYLEKELNMPNLPFKFDLERAIDDWVFMCFFVGNDFLPHLPSLEIRENAIDRLVELYKNAVYKTGVSAQHIQSNAATAEYAVTHLIFQILGLFDRQW
jgi:5'-3' exoribonuclease 2